MTTPPVVAIPTRRPYLIRAIYEWALDCGFTPYLLIAADQPGVTVPAKFVRDGRIALDINPMAVRGLDLKRDPIYFSARFNGTAYDIWVPSGAVLAIYARENGEGVMFGEPEPFAAAAAPAITGVDSHRNDGQDPKPDPPPDAPRPSGRPKLRVIK